MTTDDKTMLDLFGFGRTREGYAARIAEYEATADRRREREFEQFVREQERKYGR